jgi:S1-C subfamily serine protease
MGTEEWQRFVVDAVDRTGEGVVGIESRRARGSGVVVGDGQVLTNAHNLTGGEPGIWFGDGRRAQGKVLGADLDGDIAVVGVETDSAPRLPWSESTARLGTPVVALARPGDEPLRATLGLVSSVGQSFRGPRGRRIAGSIEHTAPLRPGSSGGPIVDAAGALVGLNTNRLGDGFYLAIPADESLAERVRALARGEQPSQRRIGVAVAPSHVARGLRRAVGLEEIDGLLVRAVDEEGPAHRGGIEAGDLIVEVAGRTIATADDLLDALEAAPVTEPLAVKVVRGADERTVKVSFEG